MPRIGLIAGNGRFPFLALEGARSLGYDVIVVAIAEEAARDLEDAARRGPRPATLHWVSLGELGRAIALLKRAGVDRAVMAGQVRHTRLYSPLVVPDEALVAALRRAAAG
ncbi:MAG TPA: hypothetical protein VNI83_05370, partial [Vicinamibacterales bacterium]|nr:hypothetical protein [Vicinamibacterales bacterium]